MLILEDCKSKEPSIIVRTRHQEPVKGNAMQ